MSINYVKQDITKVTNGIIAHGVNCLGKMGSGVALAIRTKWPKAYSEYEQFWRVFTQPKAGLLGIVQTVEVDNDLYVANCFTQVIYGHDGGRYADLDAVRESLENVFAFADHKDLQIFLPRIGCGLGGLSWEGEVEPIIHQLSEEFPHLLVTVCDI